MPWPHPWRSDLISLDYVPNWSSSPKVAIMQPNVKTSVLGTCYSKCGPRTSSSIPWELVRKVESQAPPWTCGSEFAVWKGPSVILCTWKFGKCCPQEPHPATPKPLLAQGVPQHCRTVQSWKSISSHSLAFRHTIHFWFSTFLAPSHFSP